MTARGARDGISERAPLRDGLPPLRVAANRNTVQRKATFWRRRELEIGIFPRGIRIISLATEIKKTVLFGVMRPDVEDNRKRLENMRNSLVGRLFVERCCGLCIFTPTNRPVNVQGE